ncbi:MAG: phosphoribosylformylglycinamidine synthase subunit PurL [Ardenticatenales bacterium]|nr:phosphoribosylformylglycinamidine synthase subunit PurL [Ardenticatenales bacterium]
MPIRIEVYDVKQRTNATLQRNAQALGLAGVRAIRSQTLYFLSADPGAESLERLCAFLLADPVTEEARWYDLAQSQSSDLPPNTVIIEVAYRPGVTDVAARELERGMVEMGLPSLQAATGVRYEVEGEVGREEVQRLARQLLCNETVQRYTLGPIPPLFSREAAADATVAQVPLDGLSDEDLQRLSRERLLSLDLAEMQAIREHFATVGRAPTDVELETLAQTWSEHCVHKTFRAEIAFTMKNAAGDTIHQETVDGLLNHYLRRATEQIAPAWLRSAFVDNAGIIAFDDEYDLAFKVETHNHPSALEPFGGANTGVGGVVRDIIGVSARPIATTDVLCFGPQELHPGEVPEGVLHPRRIAAGVVAGIGDYGNKLGIPTVNGAIVYDRGYIGNPLVYCGCVGLLPRGSHRSEPQAGDLIVALGGRTGRDGLHGATFSSAELTHETIEQAGSAVQIGDPITEKGLIELIEAARDEQLYHAITDCGAGGFSSAVGEMGKELGVDVDLAQVPLKYPGLRPWEIWLSEAQERMVIALPGENLARLQALAALWEVELCVLGRLTGEGQLLVRYEGEIVAEMPMDFLHEGLPRRQMTALWQEPAVPRTPRLEPISLNEALLALLADPNVASKEDVIRRYDHEVRGGTLVRPLVGPEMDGPSDAAMLKPLRTWGDPRAFTLSNGLNPWYGRRDPYRMAISAIDEAIRNAVAVGADPNQIAILDNFCWGNPTYPDRLGSLVRACQGCYDGAMAYRTPFISGKDSLYNEFNGKPIPGTLLISAIGIVPDFEKRLTMNLKQPGNLLYLLGETKAELGCSLLYRLLGDVGGEVPGLPEGALARYCLLHQAIQQGWLVAAHDLSEGGLALSLAEMALAGRLGASAQLPATDLTSTEQLFSESNGRLLLEVLPEHAEALEAHFAGEPLFRLGTVTEEPMIRIAQGDKSLIEVTVGAAVRAWKREGTS